jgi:hypothetical protein
VIAALRGLIDEVILALGPLIDAAQDPQSLKSLLADLGWTVESVPQPLLELAAAGSDLASIIGSDSSEGSPAHAIQSIKRLVDAINAVRTKPDSDFPTDIDVASFKATIGRDLLDYLFVDYLLRNRHQIGGVLRLAGLIRLVDTPGAGMRQRHLRRQALWSNAGDLLSDPIKGFREAFGWNSATPLLGDALGSLASLMESYGLQVTYFQPTGDLLRFATAGATALVGESLAIDLTFDEEFGAPSGFAAGVQLISRPPTSTRGPAISILPYARVGAAKEVAISDKISLSTRGAADFTKGVAFTLAPERSPEVQAGFLGGMTVTPAEVQIGLKLTPAPDEPERILIGTADASRLSIATVALSAGAQLISSNKLDTFVALDLENARVAIRPAPDEADSFLASFLGKDGISVQLTIGLRLSSLSGFHFTGSGGLEASLPVDVQLGPINVQILSIALKPGAQRLDLEVGATVSGRLGPLTVVMDHAGFKFTARFPDPPTGNLGPLDVGFGFLPPTGAGLSVDAAGVSGGGFLKHDPAKHEYSGVLQLQYIDLALQAFGLITTQMAGAAGYSLLALVDAEFPPVQLGWGFTLDGVGGLLAVHRTASTDALHAALKAGQLSTILFPKNAITNAPVILAQLDALFPTAPGRFLFGPMALIGWGTPNVLKAAIALVVELPEPVRVILLARIEARLPDETNPLVRINMDALGVLDLSKDELSFDAVLFDSKLVNFTLSGNMALRATWATQREFVLAIGGVHPRFTPPAGFPALQRITIDMPSGMVSKLRLAAYLALTSNSIQIGANLDVFIGVSGFGLSGHLGFDALLQRHPFRFDADISGMVAITASGDDLASVSLDATLSGPAPYHIAGKFKVHVVFFDVHVSFNHSWGEDAPSLPVPSIDVGALLGAALAERDSWDALLPDGISPLVSVRRIEDAQRVLAHPLARPGVHERVVPLGLAITRFGEAVPTGATRFAVTLQVGSGSLQYEAIQDDFAPAQFFELSDEEKLERPSFERHDAGLRVKGGLELVASGTPSVSKNTAYETSYIDEPGGVPRPDPGVTPAPTLGDLLVILQFGAAGRAATRSSGRRYQAPGNPIRVAEPAFVLVDKNTMAMSGLGPAAGANFSDVHALLAGTRSLQIVATHELAA